ncbi:MAG: MFS transporter [Actinobacteria bacterium]|nr:MAG: MFS transporter [Actinomycetota bacterium]
MLSDFGSEPPMHTPRSHSRPPGSRRAGAALLALLSLAQLMVILDVSAVNVALPDMAKDLNLSGGQLGWTITSYSLVFGSLLLLGGRAADLLGRRRMFLAGLGVFTASSLASALSAGAGAFFAARAGQGLGAAMLSPAALSIITTTFQGPQRTKALGVWGAVGGAGAAIGVLLGGMLTELIDWRAIFFINLPVSAGVLIAARRAIAPDREPPRWSGLDLRGALLATASLAAVVYALSQSGDAGWTSAQTLVLGLGGLTGLALFGALETRTRTPLLNVSRLRERGVGGGFLMMLTASSVLFGTFLLTSMYLQQVLGTGPLETGLAFLPIAISAGLGAHVGSHLIGHAGPRRGMAVAFILMSIGTMLLSRLGVDGSYVPDVLPGMVIAGLGLGIALVGVALSVLTGAPAEEAGMLSGLNTTGHEVGGSIGIAVLVSVATGSAAASPTALAGGIGDAFLVASIIATVGGIVGPLLLPTTRTFLPKLKAAPPVSVH